MTLSSLKKILEKSFFNKTFEEIKKLPLFKRLDLTDQEIIKNKGEIKNVLKNYEECGEGKKYCNTLEKHITIKRNTDNDLIPVEYKCLKWKNYNEIAPEKIDKQIQEYLVSNFFSYSSKEAIETIEKLSMETRNYELLWEILGNLGNSEYQIKSVYNRADIMKEDLIIVNSYHSILIGEVVRVITSKDLQKICRQAFYNFKKEGNEEKKYKDILETKNVIVVDFGLEDNMLKMNYYLDYFPNFLVWRKKNKKSTIIITPTSQEEIIKNIKNDSSIKASWEINKYKLQNLINSLDMPCMSFA